MGAAAGATVLHQPLSADALPDEVNRAAILAADTARRRSAIVDSVRSDVLALICDGRYENLGRLGTIVPFMPLDNVGRIQVIERQLQQVCQRLRNAEAPAELLGWSPAVVEQVLAYWDDDVG